MIAYALFIGCVAQKSRLFYLGAALAIISSVLTIAGEYKVPFPAPLARARHAENMHNELKEVFQKASPVKPPIYISFKGAKSEYYAMGFDAGIAFRLGLPLESLIEQEKSPAKFPQDYYPGKEGFFLKPDE